MDWRSSGIPIRGDFDDGWSYAFHGSGCIITSPDMEVDFEFDGKGQVGGFDLWRLWSFVCDNQKHEECIKFIEFVDKEKTQEIFDVAIVNKLIKKDDILYHLVN
jgi:hypothetical protein